MARVLSRVIPRIATDWKQTARIFFLSLFPSSSSSFFPFFFLFLFSFNYKHSLSQITSLQLLNYFLCADRKLSTSSIRSTLRCHFWLFNWQSAKKRLLGPLYLQCNVEYAADIKIKRNNGYFWKKLNRNAIISQRWNLYLSVKSLCDNVILIISFIMAKLSKQTKNGLPFRNVLINVADSNSVYNVRLLLKVIFRLNNIYLRIYVQIVNYISRALQIFRLCT